MQQHNWLTWQPKVGRNQRSTLSLHYQEEEMQNKVAEVLISEGKYEQAIDLLNGDQDRFSSLLQKTSGIKRREGQLHIQLTYQRNFSSLLPHHPLRNSERFLVRQIYSCLVSCNKHGTLTPQLAHHWATNSDASEWRFYLRPNLKFHNNEAITTKQIVKLFTSLKKLPEYQIELSHLKNIRSKGHCVIFELKSPDLSFAGLLSDLRYSIQPDIQVNTLPNLVTGSGLFRVIEHSGKRLRLQAFDDYFGLRALTDTVTIWKLEEKIVEHEYNGTTQIKAVLSNHNSSVCSHYLSIIEENNSDTDLSDKKLPQGSAQFSRIEDGCLFLLFNLSNKDMIFSQTQRRYLSQLLSGNEILKQLDTTENQLGAIAAHNLLPGWSKIHKTSTQPVELPENINIAVYDHPVLLHCANAISQQLFSLGIQSFIHIYSYSELHQKSHQKQLSEEIILSSVNLDDNRPTSAFRWFLSNSVLRQGLSDKAEHWLSNELTRIRQNEPIEKYLTELESLSSTMIYENWISPLFHHRQTLQFEGILEDVSITDWGWPAFQDVWAVD